MRLFTAIELPDDIKKRIIEKSQEIEAPGITLVKEEALHITLHFFGEKSETEAEKIKKALEELSWSTFKVNLYGINTFSPKFIRVIFVSLKEGASEVSQLYSKLSSLLDAEKISYEKEKYVPHVTIARVKYANRERLIEFINKYKDYQFGSFDVSSFYLIKSTLTSSGPVYEKLYEFKSRNVF